MGSVNAEASDLCDVAGYECRRLVIVEGECENALATLNGKSAYFTDLMSDSEAEKLEAVAVYRILL